MSLLILSLGLPIQAQITRDTHVRIVAGGGVNGAGVEGLALNVPLEGPTGVTLGPDGSVYVSEFQGGRVRKIDPTGKMTTVTGSGNVLLNGETGPALLSGIMGPAALIFDKKGNLYIAEQLGNRVRKINKKGEISTFAGTGQTDPVRDGVQATQSAVNGPNGLAFDQNGNLFVSEFLGNRIRKITPDGIITTVGGTGKVKSTGDGGPATKAGIYGPTGITFDSRGNLYIAEIIGNRVRQISPDGTISTLADKINGPSSLAFDREGNLLIAEHFGERLLRREPNGTISTLINTDVYGLAVDPDNTIRVAQITVGRVGRVERQAATSSAPGAQLFALIFDAGVARKVEENDRPGTQVTLKMPAGVTYDTAGNLYIAEITGNRIRRVDASGIITTVAGTGKRGFSGDGGPATSAELDGPGTIGFDLAGNLYIVEIIGNRVRKVDTQGNITTIAGNGQAGFAGDGGPAIDAQFNHAHWGAVNKQTGAIYIVDTLNHRIRQIDSEGIITTVAGTGVAASKGDGGTALEASFNRPENLAIDFEGNWFISEGAGHRIRKISAQGVVSTVAGTGKAGYSGDGRIATKAKLNGPTGLAISDTGVLYIADTFNSVIRRLDRDGRIHLLLGTPGLRGVRMGPANQSLFVSPWGLALKKANTSVNGVRLAVDSSDQVTSADACPAVVATTEPSNTPTIRRNQ
jgi:sugar lactone lactonase YvrE